MNNLIEAIKQYQRDKGFSDSKLTQLIKVDRSTWAKIKSGERNPGVKFLKAIARELPQFKPLIYVEITDSDLTTTPSEPSQDGKLRALSSLVKGFVLRLKSFVLFNRE